MNLIYRDEVYAIIGACFEVYNEMGSGFLEDVYQESLERELECREILFEAKSKLPIYYKGKLLTKKYEPDFVLCSKIIMEIKAVKARSLTSIVPRFTTISKLPISKSAYLLTSANTVPSNTNESSAPILLQEIR